MVLALSLAYVASEQESKTGRNMAQVKEGVGGGKERKEGYLPSPSPPSSFIFLVLVSFLARSKPKIPFHSLFLLRNQTETLATQATLSLEEGTLFSTGESVLTILLWLVARQLRISNR